MAQTNGALRRKAAEYGVDGAPSPLPKATTLVPSAVGGAVFEASSPIGSLTVPRNVQGVPQLIEILKWPKATIIREGESDYVFVNNYFLKAMQKVNLGGTVTSIYKCTRDGPLEKTRFELFRRQIDLTRSVRDREAARTRYGWHGASKEEITKILAYGFTTPTKVPDANLYGVGAYLSSAQHPELSAKLAEVDENGEKHLLLCRILVGKMEKLDLGSKQDHAFGMKYDTGSDDPSNPNWHVFWTYNMNTHILPEFVLSYKPFESNTSQERELEELLSEARNCLPPNKFEAYLSLYNAAKARVLTNEEFYRRLRTVAGDDILSSIDF